MVLIEKVQVPAEGKGKAEEPGTITTTIQDEDLEHIADLFDRMQANIDKLPDSDTKTALQGGTRIINRNFTTISQKLATSEQKKLQMEIEKEKNRANILSQYLKKELVATVVGALLLLIIVVTYAIGMLIGTSYPEILNSAFLLLLGFFFGASKST
jgi:hypothetical protein